MNTMNRNAIIKTVGVIYTAIWLSQVPYLFPHPFQQHDGVRKLAEQSTQLPEWIRQKSDIHEQTADELEKSMLSELRVGWLKSALVMGLGILSGCLLIKGKKAGCLLTFLLSMVVISIRVCHMLRYRKTSFSLEHYRFLLERMPVRTVHDFLLLLVLSGTIVILAYLFLTRKPSCLENEVV